MKLNLPNFYATADAATKDQLWKIAVEAALEHLVTSEDLSKTNSDQIALNNRLVALFPLVKALSDRITVLENKKTKKSQLGDL